MQSCDKNKVPAGRVHWLAGPPPWNRGLATGLQDDSINMSTGAPGAIWLTPFVKERVREHPEGEKQETRAPAGPGLYLSYLVTTAAPASPGRTLCGHPWRTQRGMFAKKAFQGMVFP